MPEDSVTIPIKSSRKQYQQQHQLQQTTSHHQTTSDNHTTLIDTTGSLPLTTTTTSTAPPRGRISRLKPKEDTYVVDVPNNCTSSTGNINLAASYSIVQCDTLEQSTTTAIEYTQDTTPALETTQQQQKKQIIHFPVIDDNKPFVCQQCGLAFSREKAMLSHTKVSLQNLTNLRTPVRKS